MFLPAMEALLLYAAPGHFGVHLQRLLTIVTFRVSGDGVVELESAVYFCEEENGVCKVDGAIFRIPVSSDALPRKDPVRLTHAIKVKASNSKGKGTSLPLRP
jgi:hypothetical protein